MNFKAVIFDMDGLLIDSMFYWVRNDKEFFKNNNLSFSEDLIREFSGKGFREVAQIVKDKFNLEDSLEEIIKKNVNRSEAIYDWESEPMPGAKELISRLSSAGVDQAIASGSPKYRIQKIVDRFNWSDYFSHLVSVDHVEHKGKPDPAIYTKTAELMGVEPEQCVVLEDAQNGLESAQRAGMKCIAVPDSRWSPGDFSSADLLASSLEDKAILNFLGL
jgi:HAD superfamily hydrolase (TIGR01509 family)